MPGGATEKQSRSPKIALGAQGGASRAIAVLYDQMERDAPPSPPFATVATQSATDPVPCLPDHSGFAARLGHASDGYALADSQRGALTHVPAAEHGEVVAVNGPPGTGKTTLLLSVVASLWVKAALAGGEPPLIFAASTNNQAVTNVIDASGADFAHGAVRKSSSAAIVPTLNSPRASGSSRSRGTTVVSEEASRPSRINVARVTMGVTTAGRPARCRA